MKKLDKMKRLIFIISIVIAAINLYGQSEIKRDVGKFDDQIYFRGDSLKKWVDDNAPSGTPRDAGNGLTLDVNDLDLGGTLDAPVIIEGAGNAMYLGRSTSKLSNLFGYSSGYQNYSTDAYIQYFVNGKYWQIHADDFINLTNGDTLSTLAEVRALIAASEQLIPLNFNYTFDATTTDSRPGVGLFRLNNATLGSVTEIYIDYFDANSIAKNDFLTLVDTGSYITIASSETQYANYQITGGYIDNSNYVTYKVAYQSHSGAISGSSLLALDLSNSTGTGGGGAADSVYSTLTALDTLTVGDSLQIYKDGVITRFKSYYLNSFSELSAIIHSKGGSQLSASDGTDEAYFKANPGGMRISAEKTGSNDEYRVDITDTYWDYTFRENEAASERIVKVGIDSVEFEKKVTADIVRLDTIDNNEVNIVDGNLQIAKFTKDTTFIDSTIKTKHIVSDKQTLGGTTSTGMVASKFVIENTLADSISIGGYVIRFNRSEGVHEFETGQNGVVWQGALEDLVQVYNNTGQTVSNGTPFFLGQSTGDTIVTIGIASANVPAAKAVAGLITGDISSGSWGFGAIRGKVRNMNTSALSLTGVTWLSNDSSLTATAPAYPSEKIIMGGVIKVHATDGIFYVDPSLAFVRQLKTKSFSFTSQGVASGQYWKAGFYDAPAADANLTQAAATVTYGGATIAYEAHPFAVYGGAGSVTGGGRVALITTGTSYDDATGNQTASDVDTLINDITTTTLNGYNETKKYLGTVTYQLVIVEGAPSAYSLDFNYGYAKYDDIGDRDFYITGLECVWRGAQTDATGFDIELLHHKATGWTYSAAAFTPGDGNIAQRSVDQAGFLGVLTGTESAWKRTGLSTFIDGSGGIEGFIWKVSTGANSTIQTMDMHIEVALD